MRELVSAAAEKWRRWLGPAAVAVLLLLAAARCGARSVREADELLASINIRAPRLAEAPGPAPASPVDHPLAAPLAPPLGVPLAAPLTRRVVLLVIDGLGEAASHGLPELDRLRQLGLSAVATSHLPSLSRPNYVSILTGVPPAHSGVRTNDYAWEVPLDSLLHRVRASARQTAFATDVAPGFGAMFSRQLSDATAAPWPGGWLRAGLLALDRRYPLVVLIPGAVDNAGHQRGAGSRPYREAALQVDRQLGELMRALDLTRDTLVVTADHGHTAAGGHGGDEPEVMRVPLVMAGAGVRRGALAAPVRLIDLAPTLAALLGTPPPRHALGRCLGEALQLPERQAAALAERDRARVQALEAWLAAAPSDPSGGGEPPRPLLDRAFACFALAVLLLFVVRVAERQQLVHVDRRLAAVALAAPLSAVLALAAGAGGELSLSTLANRAEGTRVIAAAAAAVVAAHLAGAWWALARRPLRQRLAAANALVLIALSLATLLASSVAALLGSPPWQRLPSAPLLLLTPFAQMSLATCALGCTLVLAIELVVFAARRS